MTTEANPRTFGLLGSLIGLAAVAVTVLHFFFGPIAEPEPVESFIAEQAAAIKDAVAAKLRGETYVPPKPANSFDPDLALERGTIAAALLAVGLGVLGLLRREEGVPSGLALGLGGAAVVFSFSVAIAGLLIAAILIGAVVIALGAEIGG